LGILQRILETTCIKKEHRSGGGPSTRPRTEEDSVKSALTWLTREHRTIQIDLYALEFPVGKLQEQIKALGQLNIVLSKIPIQILQDLQTQLVQEIKNGGDTMNQDLERLRDERAQVQEKYDISLQQKKDIEGRIEEVLNNK